MFYCNQFICWDWMVHFLVFHRIWKGFISLLLGRISFKVTFGSYLTNILGNFEWNRYLLPHPIWHGSNKLGWCYQDVLLKFDHLPGPSSYDYPGMRLNVVCSESLVKCANHLSCCNVHNLEVFLIWNHGKVIVEIVERGPFSPKKRTIYPYDPLVPQKIYNSHKCLQS